MKKMNRFTNLIDLLEWRVAEQPDATVYTFLVDGELEEVHLTYRVLVQKAQAVAAWLQQKQAVGERALLLYPSGLDYIVAFFGCLYAGTIAVPAYPPRMNRPNPRLKGMVADAQVKYVLTTSKILQSKNKQITHSPDLAALEWLATDSLTDELANLWQRPMITADSLAFLQYTSGSTAIPKGVMVSHGNLLANEEMIRQAFGHDHQPLIIGWLPIYHDMGLIGNVLQPMYIGSRLVFMSPTAFLQRPFRWLNTISRYQAHTSGGPNFAYDICVHKITSDERAQLDLSHWQNAFNGAEPIRWDTLQRFTKTFAPHGFSASAFYPCYGLAESTLFVTGSKKSVPSVLASVHAEVLQSNRVLCLDETAPDAQTLVGSGTACINETIKIVDPDTLLACQPDKVGEIWVSGPHIAHGYWQNESATKETFHAYLATGEGPFLRTGDLGFLQDGELFVTGRLKDLIIIYGRNYYPQDIEFVVANSHPALPQNHTAAFSIPVAGEERLVVVQEVGRHYLQIDMDAAIKNVRAAIADEFDLPVYAVVLIKPLTIPKTTSGKIRRNACRSHYLAGKLPALMAWQMTLTTSDDSSVEWANSANLPDTVTKRAVEAWFAQKLNEKLGISKNEIDLNQSFAYYGLDSARALGMIVELEKWLGRRLNPTVLWNYPTITSLAGFLAAETTDVNNRAKSSLPKLSDNNSQAALQETVEQLSHDDMVDLITQELAISRQRRKKQSL